MDERFEGLHYEGTMRINKDLEIGLYYGCKFIGETTQPIHGLDGCRKRSLMRKVEQRRRKRGW